MLEETILPSHTDFRYKTRNDPMPLAIIRCFDMTKTAHNLRYKLAMLLTVAASALSAHAQSGVFTATIGSTPQPPVALVRFDDFWSYHKGTNAPQADWKVSDDDGLIPSQWASGRGGFGYEDGDDNTVLSDMLGLYTTVYIRKSFQVSAPIDPAARLFLRMDWDDGFIAWLDGVEIARSPNAPGAVGTEPANTAISNPPNHNSSADPAPSPAVIYDLGSAATRLTPGFHTLAVMGLNGGISSSDLSLIADLYYSGASGGITHGDFFTLVQSNQVVLTGTNTLANSTRVTVNGVNATYNSVDGAWSKTQALTVGMNHLFIAAHDAQGNILGAISRDVIAETASTSVGGIITANTTWASNSVVRVTNNVTIRDGATLTISQGSVILLPATLGIAAGTNGVVNAAGTYENPIFFVPANGTTPWREIAANGTNSVLNLHHVETVAGQVRALNAGTLLIEDSTLRDLTNNLELVAAVDAASVTVRRCHALRFIEMDSRRGPFLAEDCLLERILIDGMDIKEHSSLVVRRSTFRYGAVRSGVEDVDGVDLGPGVGPIVENCLFRNLDDKGVSIGDNTPGTIVRNSLFYNCTYGISAYGSTNCVLSNNTITECGIGVSFRAEGGSIPATGTASNLIVWANITNVAVFNGASLNLSFSDVDGGFPGAGNIDDDPLFVNSPGKDFHLSPGSPALGMGTTFPVGGIPSAPFNLAAIVDGTNDLQLTWEEDADNEVAFLIERSTNGMNWEYLGFALPNVTWYTDSSAALGELYFYRVRAENSSGISHFSNIAANRRAVPTVFVGGTLAADTVWSPLMGNIIVISNITVPTNITLTMLPGTSVKVTNNAGILAVNGGTIEIMGTGQNKVMLAPLTPGSTWVELSASGAGSSLTVRYADVAGGRTAVRNAAAGLLEDSFFHDFRLASCTTMECPIVTSSFASSMVVRRCHVREYYETLFRDGVILVEDCLFEFMSGDALDFDGAQPGTILRKSTFRHGTRAPVNIDAVDVGPGALGACRDVIIEDCLMFDFPTDKGVSIGDAPQQAVGTIVRNCLIYDCRSGVQVKDSCFAQVYNCTIVSNRWGFTNYNKANPSAPTGGGHTTNAHNNILWDNNTTISMWNGGTLTADHNILGNTNWPGEGNLNVNPLFVNAAGRDYRLLPGSPCIGTGRDGATMGAKLPVGALMAPSNPYFTLVELQSGQVVLRFWADNEKAYDVQRSPTATGGSWSSIGNVSSPGVPTLAEIRDPIAPGTSRFYRLSVIAQP